MRRLKCLNKTVENLLLEYTASKGVFKNVYGNACIKKSALYRSKQVVDCL